MQPTLNSLWQKVAYFIAHNTNLWLTLVLLEPPSPPGGWQLLSPFLLIRSENSFSHAGLYLDALLP